MCSGKVLLGVMAGIAVGALAGILYAPAKGSKTRKRILKKSEDYSDALSEKLNELIDAIIVKFDNVMEDCSFCHKKNG